MGASVHHPVVVQGAVAVSTPRCGVFEVAICGCAVRTFAVSAER